MKEKTKSIGDAHQPANFVVERSTMDSEELEEHRKRLAGKNQKPGNLGSSADKGSDVS